MNRISNQCLNALFNRITRGWAFNFSRFQLFIEIIPYNNII